MSRFVAYETEANDSLGQPNWVVFDTAHDRVEQEFDGYFASTDAQQLAEDLNDEEAAMAGEDGGHG